MRTLTTLVFVAAIAFTGCKKKEKDQGAAPPATADAAGAAKPADAAPAPTADAAAAATGDGGTAAATGDGGAEASAMQKEAGNCPSTVAGAETAIDKDASKDGKVVVRITSKDEGAVPTIRARAKHLVDVQGAPDTTIKHTGEGTGGGKGGLCPVYAADGVKIAATDVDGGVAVTLEASDKAKSDALLADVTARVDKASTWTKENIKATEGDVGGKAGNRGGTGGHGGNRSGKGDGSGPKTGGGDGKGTGAATK